jgi:hypothetical protein
VNVDVVVDVVRDDEHHTESRGMPRELDVTVVSAFDTL